MNLYEKIIELRPELTQEDFNPFTGTIELRNDSDGFGSYIARWDHPTAQQPADEVLGITRKPTIIEGEVIAPTEMLLSDAKLDMSQFAVEPAAE